ncbi:sigma 54-interacting transcriptional regulator [Flavobacterium sp. CAU 1735]|uniref:sigma-54-dependent Fis family transcriptional regulator n=1 Tax=Flavobacterium sp. CAU 1735 TaxID=3140361 RepID=UPI0032603855
MENPKDQATIMMNRLQEREREQQLILSVCQALSGVVTHNELHTVVGSLLKDHFSFEDLIIASSDKNETEYRIFYQYTVLKPTENTAYPVNDGFFDSCLDTADTVVFDLKPVSERKQLPVYLDPIASKGIKNGIGIGLPIRKDDQTVLFLFFKNASVFTRESNRMLRGIATQLAITIGNIKMATVYESSFAELQLLKKQPVEQPETTVASDNGFYGIIGKSKAMQQVYELITQVAPSPSTVLIFGETGTGKELIANAIHKLSPAFTEKLITVNCASIPENLIESELFGHEKGAFTGATATRIGKFEQADNGTIFLDEIGELPLELQGKLLRVLQEKEIERIAGKNTLKVKVRVIAATNRSLEKEVAEGRFRSDLFYRLNVFPIALPALRDRSEDIEPLAHFFLEKHSLKTGKKSSGFSKKVLKSMIANTWPGNVRELENMVERSILFAKEGVIKEMTFPTVLKTETTNPETELYTATLQEVEKAHILKVVKKCNGKIFGPQGAAVVLGLPGTTLISKMQKLGIKKEHYIS